MESANPWERLAEGAEGRTRVAEQADSGAITRLLEHAPYTHIHADWHYPSEWLDSPTFVIVPESAGSGGRRSFSSRLFGDHGPLAGCLAVAADPGPAAWVRVAGIADAARGLELMALMLAAIVAPLREANVSQIAWLLVEGWPEMWLPDLGFEKINEVVTYSKLGTNSPRASQPDGLDIRPVRTSDLTALAEIESRAFEPLWRHSEWSLSLARQQAISFDVAWLGESPVGFQFSTPTLQGAHLSRITVDPVVQSCGVGSAVLAHALEGYAQRGIPLVTLNTQLDNVVSQRLYEKFGFQRSSESFPVYSVSL
ncbi:MAG: GNAT family N-acetyltransferase [Candidatus Promineifilaceae bacterium]